MSPKDATVREAGEAHHDRNRLEPAHHLPGSTVLRVQICLGLSGSHKLGSTVSVVSLTCAPKRRGLSDLVGAHIMSRLVAGPGSRSRLF